MNFDIDILFKKDIFSRQGPKYIQTDKKYSDMVNNIISEYYSNLIRNISDIASCIYCIEGIEINSTNFFFISEEKKFVIKKLTHNYNNKISFLTNIFNELSKKLPIPSIIFNNENNLFSLCDKGFYWIVMDLLEGKYYDGHDLETLGSIAESHNKLHTVLENHISTKDNFETYIYKIGDEKDLWNFIIYNQNKLNNYLQKDHIDFLLNNLQIINNALDLTDFFNIDIKVNELSHADWHPLNLLIKNNAVSAILDLDSMNLSNKNISVAFGLFKFLRQYFIYNKNNISNASSAVNLYIKNAYSVLPAKEEILYCAKTILLRKLFYVLRDIITNKDQKWTNVLSVQINGLQEIDYILSFYNK